MSSLASATVSPPGYLNGSLNGSYPISSSSGTVYSSVIVIYMCVCMYIVDVLVKHKLDSYHNNNLRRLRLNRIDSDVHTAVMQCKYDRSVTVLTCNSVQPITNIVAQEYTLLPYRLHY
jgi:hypothetical protein